MLGVRDKKSVFLDERLVYEDAEAGVRDAVLMGDGSVCCAAGRHVVVIPHNGTGVPWRVESKKKVVLLAVRDDNIVLYADAGGSVRALNLVSRETCDIFAHFAPVTAMAVIHKRYIVTGDADMQIRVSRLDRPREIVYFLLGHESPVVAFLLPTRALEHHLVGSVSTMGVTLWHSLLDGKQVVEHPFERVDENLFKRKPGHGKI